MGLTSLPRPIITFVVTKDTHLVAKFKHIAPKLTEQPTPKPVVTTGPTQGGTAQTGDTTNMTLWIILAVVALGGCTGLIGYRYKNKKHK